MLGDAGCPARSVLTVRFVRGTDNEWREENLGRKLIETQK
jgi:hypothetical protein